MAGEREVSNPSPAPDGGPRDRLRVAFVAGCLGQGGSEKQLFYMVRALRMAKVDVAVYSLTQGEHYERRLEALGCPPQWVGRWRSPSLRLVTLAARLRAFRPHVVQSAHSFANLYAAAGACVCGAMAVGALRGQVAQTKAETGPLSRLTLAVPAAILANSDAARRELERRRRRRPPVRVLANVIDLAEFDRQAARPTGPAFAGKLVVAMVGRLIPVKRFDRSLAALAAARRIVPELQGLVIGDGPERDSLQQLAARLVLRPDGVRFLGAREDVPSLLAQADMLLLSSDHEGCPNVLLEAMAARLPVLTTPAGDSARIVSHGVTGYVVPFHDTTAMADRLVELARSPSLRRRMGSFAGRARVEECYDAAGLGEQLLSHYRAFAGDLGHRTLALRCQGKAPP